MHRIKTNTNKLFENLAGKLLTPRVFNIITKESILEKCIIYIFVVLSLPGSYIRLIESEKTQTIAESLKLTAVFNENI